MKQIPAILAVVVLLVWTAVVLFPTKANGAAQLPKGIETVYYFSSSTGNDLNTGLSEKQAFKSLDKLQDIMGPGVAALFKYGDDWHDYTTEFTFNAWRGSSGAPVYLGAYGDAKKPKPIIADMAKYEFSKWQALGGDMYSTTQIESTATDLTIRLYINGSPLRKMPTRGEVSYNQYCFENGKLIIKVKDFTAQKVPYVETIHFGGSSGSFSFSSMSYLTIENISFRGGNGGGQAGNFFSFYAPNNNVTLKGCNFTQFRGYGVTFGPQPGRTGMINRDILIENCFVDKGWTQDMNSEAFHTIGYIRNGLIGRRYFPNNDPSYTNASEQNKPNEIVYISSGGDGICFIDCVEKATVRGCTVLNMGHSAIGNQLSGTATGTSYILLEKNYLDSRDANCGRGFAFCGEKEKCQYNVFRQNFIRDMHTGDHFGGYRCYMYSNIIDTVTPAILTDYDPNVMAAIDTMAGNAYGGGTADLVFIECVIANNTIYKADLVMDYHWPAGDASFVDKVYFANNIVANWGDSGYTVQMHDSWQPFIKLQNNAFYQSGKGANEPLMTDYSTLYPLDKLNQVPDYVGNRYIDPGFVSDSKNFVNDFALKSTSAIKNGGIPLAKLLPQNLEIALPPVDILGNKYDASSPSIGAIQYGGKPYQGGGGIGLPTPPPATKAPNPTATPKNDGKATATPVNTPNATLAPGATASPNAQESLAPNTTPKPDAPKSKSATPWWPFALGGALIAGAGTYFFRRGRKGGVA